MARRNRCKDCEWFKSTERTQASKGFGDCHRYPNPVPVTDKHWCGKFEVTQEHKRKMHELNMAHQRRLIEQEKENFLREYFPEEYNDELSR